MFKITLFRKALLASLISLQAATAGTLTNLSFTSNGGAFTNDTISGNGTSPLAFTLSGATSNSFLNNADSTISLGFGSYYAIGFLGFGQHLGSGTVSFILDGVTTVSQNVTFPTNAPGGVVFATFNLAGGDVVEVSTTGLSADRISIVADGGGLTPDGAPDAFYQFSYTDGSLVPEPSSIGFAALGLAALVFRLRQK